MSEPSVDDKKSPAQEDGLVATKRPSELTVSRHAIVRWHAFTTWVRKPGLFLRGVWVVGSFYLIAWPHLKLGWQLGAFGFAMWVVMGFMRVARELDPRHMQMLKHNYVARKLLLYRLIQQMERAREMTTAEVATFQREALHLIATYVRDHRRDLDQSTIFANLLALEGDDVVVVARDRAHRKAGARYPRAGMIVAEAIDAGEPMFSGDIQLDYPESVHGKTYRSVLVLPVRDGADRVVGAVSIDSSERYHFDLWFRDFVEGLAPYVALLAWTLNIGRTTVDALGSEIPEGPP